MHQNSHTYQEIVRQQTAWKRALAFLEANKEEQRRVIEPYHGRTWVFSGCGTSYYLAQTAAAVFSMITGIRTRAAPASEIMMFPDLVFPGGDEYLLVALSRSGTTTETVLAARRAREERRVPTLAISCDPHSALSTESPLRLEFPFEKERSVVMTGSFTTLLLSVMFLGSLMAKDDSLARKLNEMADIGADVTEASEAVARSIAADAGLEDFVFLGQGPFAGIAAEAGLKMQEMAISVSHAYHSLEYRHGPMSTASGKTLIALLSTHAAGSHERKLAQDLKRLGARILVVSEAAQRGQFAEADYHITVPDGFGDELNALFYMPPLQLLACHRAFEKNIDPDNPRNLTAVVKLGA